MKSIELPEKYQEGRKIRWNDAILEPVSSIDRKFLEIYVNDELKRRYEKQKSWCKPGYAEYVGNGIFVSDFVFQNENGDEARYLFEVAITDCGFINFVDKHPPEERSHLAYGCYSWIFNREEVAV